MPLVARCEGCGGLVYVKRMQEDRKMFLIRYDCAKCGYMDHEEEVPKWVW